MTDDQTPITDTTDTPSDTPSSPITVKPGWWKMRDGEEIQVFEWKPDPPAPGHPFKFCGMTPAGDVIYWTDGGYCNFNASPAGLYISDADLTEFLRPLDTDQIVSLSETLQQKHRVIQEMTHQIADLQTNLAAVKLQADTMADTIMTQAKMIDYQRTNIEATVTNRLADLQQRYNDMVFDRDGWQDTVRHLQHKLDTQAAIIANRLAELSRLREQISHPNLSLIVSKLATPDNQQQQQIIISGLMILSQLVRKNMDYSGSAFTPPILLPKVSPIVAMCCRASDKIARLANLLSGTRKQVESETVLDTIGDLAGYATLLYSYCNTIQGTAELEAIIETADTHTTTTATTTDTTDTTTTTIDTTEERQS